MILKDVNRRYYQDGETEFTDDEFDALAAHVGFSTTDSTAQASIFTVVDHLVPMPGIASVSRTVEEWIPIGSILPSGWVSKKLDGLSVELQYDKNGRLSRAVLRGDGITGEDVTENAKHCRGVPLGCNATLVSVRCELVVSSNNLVELNRLREEDGQKPYSSRRSAVTIVRSTPSPSLIHRLALLTAVVIDVHFVDPTKGRLSADAISAFCASATPSGSPKRFTPVQQIHASPAGAWMFRGDTNIARDGDQYQLDGVVFRADNGTMHKLKFPSSAEITTVVAVIEQLGRTGIVTPVCEVEPIVLIGAKVRRATLHNIELAGTKFSGIGPGAKVLVSRRGDVIPHIEALVEPSTTPWEPSGACPSCGAPTVLDGAVARCSSDPTECAGTVLGLMRKFCMSRGMKGFGVGVLSALVNAGLDKPHYLFTIDAETLANLEQPGGSKVGPVIATRLVNEAARRASMTFGELLASIGVPGCAESIMESVARFVHGDVDRLDLLDIEHLMTIPGIGPERAAAIAAYLDYRLVDTIDPLVQVVRLVRSSGPLNGKSFCITLALRSGSRPQVEARIRACGGTVKNSVSRNLSYLVCNTPDEQTAKLKKAREYGIPIVSEEVLLKMIGNSAPSDSAPAPVGDDF